VTPRARLALAVMALLAVVAIVYAPVRRGVFIWDDHALVETSKLVIGGSVVDILRQPFLPPSAATDARPVYYRPLTVLSLRADYGVAGAEAASFHVSNVLLHLAAIVAFILTARRLGASMWASMLAASTWALHPRNTEAVAWISGRTDVLATLFALTAVALWPWYGDAPDAGTRARARACGAGTALVLALLAKEVAVAALLAIVVGTWVGDRGRTWRERAGRLARRVGYVGVPVAAYLVLRLCATRSTTSRLTSIGMEARAGTLLEAVGRYVEMSLDAWHPATSIGLLGEVDRGRAVVGALVLAGGGALFVRALVRRARATPSSPGAPASSPPITVAITVSATLALGSLGLVVHILPIGLAAGVVADRLLYLPLAGVALSAALASRRLTRRAQAIAGAVAVLVTASFVPVTRARAQDYTDELRFRVVAAENAHPHNTSAQSGLANALRASGEIDLACRLHLSVRHSLERMGRTGTTRHVRALENLGACYEVLGAYDRATPVYEQLLVLRPQDGHVHLKRGYLHLHVYELDQAEAAFQRALALDTTLVLAREALAELPSIRAGLARLATPEQRQADRVGWVAVLTRLGRVPDATSAWLPIVEDPRTTDGIAWDGYEFLLSNADFATARRAGEAYFLRPAIDVHLGRQLLANRRAKQASIDAFRARIEALAAD
jgi:protein O-mannosyl-transferase